MTQVRWGIADFKHRFGHHPAGMWLPETAVDSETLEVLAEYEIAFTILAPWQADEDEMDVMQPYRVMLKDDQDAISVFFYHSGLSSGISFTPLSDGGCRHLCGRHAAAGVCERHGERSPMHRYC